MAVHLHLLLVAIVPVLAEIEMEFTKYPESVAAPVGDEVTFECAVRVPGERLQWRWKAADGDWRQWKEVPARENDGVSTKLVVDVNENMVDGLYQCVIWYGAISLVSIPAKLSIARLDLTQNTPEKRVITAPLFNTVVLHCKEPKSEPPAVLSWWKENGKGSRKQLETPHGVLVIHNATAADDGTYGCAATNEISGQSIDLPERTYLRVQHEGNGGVRFLETEEYVGKYEKEVLLAPVGPDAALRLWCGAVGTPPPKITWSKEGSPSLPRRHDHTLIVSPFTTENEGIYSCSANGIRRSWKAIALQPPHWEGSAGSVNASEGGSAHVACGRLYGQPPPAVHWILNAELIESGKGIRATDSDLYIDHVEKRHAGIVQCFACNELGCAYDAAMLTVVPVQISEQDYTADIPKSMHIPSQPPKKHNRKNSRKNKAVLIAPTRPNVTRLSDESVMVSWTHSKHGLPIQFFKVQYREVTNSSNVNWKTATDDIKSSTNSYDIGGLVPDKYYKFRIAAVYSNQDNKLGRSSPKFYLRRGGSGNRPRTPNIAMAVALSPHSLHLNWTWSSEGGVEAEGFYVYFRAVSSAGAYEKVNVEGTARSVSITHLAPDTAYELKLQAYTTQAPSGFSSRLVAKTLRAAATEPITTVSPTEDVKEEGPTTLVTAGGIVGATALLLILAVTLLLCKRSRRPASKEKGSAEGGGNGYMPAKVPITITANPMHTEGEAGVEMSFLHNNNCGNNGNDDTLPHSRKNGPSRQYV
ncbi:interference hedgehog [Pieris rapae]|uniref:interference hedgehog n=1 Tax=Pieris rapae TaxID=64459 RepID=UPI001E27B7AE|nr:interference hedgehog [Pieris rapae]